MIVIEWENKPDATYEDSEVYADRIEELLAPLGYQFLVRGYDNKERYCKIVGHIVEGMEEAMPRISDMNKHTQRYSSDIPEHNVYAAINESIMDLVDAQNAQTKVQQALVDAVKELTEAVKNDKRVYNCEVTMHDGGSR